MSESDRFFFSKKYKVAAKHDQDAFYIRYQLGQERESSSSHVDLESNSIPQSSKHYQSNDKKAHQKNNKASHFTQDNQHKNKPKYKLHEKSDYVQKKYKEASQKEQTKPEAKLVSVQRELQEKLPPQMTSTLSEKVTKVQKQSLISKDVVPLKTRISEIEDEQELEAENINKEINSQLPNYRSSKRMLRQETIYLNLTNITDIEESRENNEKIYFKGRVEFSSEVKWSARIYSDQKDGYLLAQGKQNLNRALQQDEVYFKVLQEKKQYFICEIVSIISRRNKELVGKIQKSTNSDEYFLRPINRKIANMTVDKAYFDQNWVSLIDTHFFLCEFASWQLDQSFPVCRVLDVYGVVGDINIEINALLKTYGVKQNNQISTIQPFSNFFDNNSQFKIPYQQIKNRKDFRRWQTFVVQDTPFDVAYSIFPQITRPKGDPNFLKKNVYDINIHILDLAFFVNKSYILDDFLRTKMTLFNLSYKIIPLLPQFLLKATSFQLNKERLTISICIQVSQDGKILDSIKVTTSVITPQCILSKAQFQKWINTQKIPYQQLKKFKCKFQMQSEFAAFAKDLKIFANLMKKARINRIQSGAFDFQAPNKHFEFDQKNNPIKFDLKTKTEVDLILQECIIISQTKIAEFMMKSLKQKVILYRHRYPGSKMFERLGILVAKAGYPVEDRKQIKKSINSLLSDEKVKQVVKQAIKYQISKLIQNSDYFQSEAEDPTKWNNFAFNIAMFTNCVMPKKKYGDILVQKQLVALIQRRQFKVQNLKKVLQEVNKGTLRSRKIRGQSQKIILCHYLRQHPAFTTGILLQVFEWGLKICATKYGFKTIIKFEDISSLKVLKSDADSNNRKYVKVEFKRDKPAVETFFVLKELQEIELQVRCSKSIPYSYQVVLVMPNPADTKQKLLIE